LDKTQHQNIIASVRILIQVLRSGSVALDRQHTPALYAHFLSSQLARHNVFTDSDNDVDSAVQTKEIIPQYGDDCQQMLPNQFACPDPENVQRHLVHCVPNSQPGVVLQQFEADMDFSVQHITDFVKTHDTISATGIIELQPEEIFANWESVYVNIAEKTNQDIAWSAVPAEAGAWIHAPY
jgi:hypothetical protein